MAQQIIVIGLGQFGMSLAVSLAAKGAEVLAVDIRKDLVEEVSTFVSEALIIDATDEKSLINLNPSQREVAVCAIGEDSKEASIICTALLRQMGISKVIARANSPMHSRILTLVGAHQIVNPEQEFGERFASKIIYSKLISDMPLGEDLHLAEIMVDETMIGKNLIDLALPKKHGVMVVATRRGTPSEIILPDPQEPLQKGDRLLVVSQEEAINKWIKGN